MVMMYLHNSKLSSLVQDIIGKVTAFLKKSRIMNTTNVHTHFWDIPLREKGKYEGKNFLEPMICCHLLSTSYVRSNGQYASSMVFHLILIHQYELILLLSLIFSEETESRKIKGDKWQIKTQTQVVWSQRLFL